MWLKNQICIVHKYNNLSWGISKDATIYCIRIQRLELGECIRIQNEREYINKFICVN